MTCRDMQARATRVIQCPAKGPDRQPLLFNSTGTRADRRTACDRHRRQPRTPRFQLAPTRGGVPNTPLARHRPLPPVTYWNIPGPLVGGCSSRARATTSASSRMRRRDRSVLCMTEHGCLHGSVGRRPDGSCCGRVSRLRGGLNGRCAQEPTRRSDRLTGNVSAASPVPFCIQEKDTVTL